MLDGRSPLRKHVSGEGTVGRVTGSPKMFSQLNDTIPTTDHLPVLSLVPGMHHLDALDVILHPFDE